MKISVKKYIRSDKNGEYKFHCAEICLESEISNYYHIHLSLMKNRTLKEMMDALFISSGLHKTCVEELSLLQKGLIKSFVHLERKRFCLIRIWSFPYEKWKERKSNLKYFKVWGYLVKVQDPIPNRIKIGPMTVDCKVRL